jgi:hypothetical protein
MDTFLAFELERRLANLDTLLADLTSGRFHRTTFQPWEVEVLLDIQACNVGDANKKKLLKRYQKAAHRWFDRGGRTLLMLSDYRARRHCQAPVNGGFAPVAAPSESTADELS